MNRFIDFLFSNPLVAIVLIGWLVGGLGKMLKNSAEASQRRQAQGPSPTAGQMPTQSPRQGQQRPQRPTQAPWPTAQQQQQRTASAPWPRDQPQPMAQQRAQPPAPGGRAGQRPTADDVAAEMRRILGMDPPARGSVRQSQQVRPTAVERIEPPRIEIVPAAPPRGAVGSMARQLGTRVDPHVGEGIKDRSSPSSGGVGHAAFGTLGGRAQARRPMTGRHATRLVDLRDLAKVMVLKEILDKPLGLRDR